MQLPLSFAIDKTHKHILPFVRSLSLRNGFVFHLFCFHLFSFLLYLDLLFPEADELEHNKSINLHKYQARVDYAQA